MSIDKWLAEGRLQRHKTSREEIDALLKVAERDAQDAAIRQISPDWRFSIAYNAALSLATIPLLVAGYRTVPSKGGHHAITILALPETMGPEQKRRAKQLNTARTMRHNSTYDDISLITEAQADELLESIKQFRQDVLAWLEQSKF